MSDDLDLELADQTPEHRGPAAPLVLMGREAMQAIEAHARQDLNRELGGVLLGAAASSPEGTIVVVEAAIPALHTDAGRGSITFTHDTWEQINRVKDREHPDRRIVGWYHTHPGFGLFLSDYDVFIHTNFFNLPWQVAFVIDPRTAASGFFVWEGGQIAGPRQFEVVGPRPQAPATPPAPPVAPPRDPTAWRVLMTAGLIIVLVMQILSLARRPVAVAPDAATTADIARLRDMLQALDQTPDTPPPQRPTATTYTVQPGDSLWRIARRHYGRGAMWGAIAVANGLQPDDLEPGMVLKIPLPPSREADNSGEPGSR